MYKIFWQTYGQNFMIIKLKIVIQIPKTMETIKFKSSEYQHWLLHYKNKTAILKSQSLAKFHKKMTRRTAHHDFGNIPYTNEVQNFFYNPDIIMEFVTYVFWLIFSLLYLLVCVGINMAMFKLFEYTKVQSSGYKFIFTKIFCQ